PRRPRRHVFRHPCRVGIYNAGMDDVPIAGHEENKLFKQFLGQYGPPAFMRRARRVEEAYAALIAACETKRHELLEFVRLHLGTLYALAGDWNALRSVLRDDAQLAALQSLHEELSPRLRVSITPTASQRALRNALDDLIESLERFNRR